MGNTPSNQHGSPKPDRQGNQQQQQQQGAGSGGPSRNPNLRLPMPACNTSNLSPSNSNPASPSGTRSGSPRRRKSLELPDLNKLSFTPAAPVPTTATHTSHHLAPSTTANQPIRRPADGPSTSTSPSSPVAPPKRWQQVLGGHSPLTQGLSAMSPLSKSAPATRQPSGSRPPTAAAAPPTNQSYFPAQAPALASASASAPRDRDVSPSSQKVAAPIPIPGSATGTGTPTSSTEPTSDRDDGTVNVPISWTGGGRTVMLAGNFANNWKGRIPMVRGVNDFHTTLRLRPGQYRLKFIVDDSWRCSKTIPTATDDDGTLVNWIEVDVPKTAEEVTSEWAMDSVPPAKLDNDDSQWTNVIPGSVYLYQYLEEFPHTFETLDEYRAHMASIPHMSPIPQPPHLPRLLEKVILNSDSKSKWDDSHLPGWDHAPPAGLDDNSILAVPNHVVLNHLTASAIKNGTLGVGTTTRYRKKYITTMFFKPTLADLKDDRPLPPSQAPSLSEASQGTAPSAMEQTP